MQIYNKKTIHKTPISNPLTHSWAKPVDPLAQTGSFFLCPYKNEKLISTDWVIRLQHNNPLQKAPDGLVQSEPHAGPCKTRVTISVENAVFFNFFTTILLQEMQDGTADITNQQPNKHHLRKNISKKQTKKAIISGKILYLHLLTSVK